MDDINIDDTAALAELIGDLAGTGEVWRSHRFQVSRHSPVNGAQVVDVEVLDRGAGANPRFHVSGRTDDGAKQFSGNSDVSLRTALATAHWYELDK